MSAGTSKKKIDRMVQICGDPRVVQQTWRPSGKGGFMLPSVLLRKGRKTPLGGKINQHVPAGAEVSVAAAQQAEDIRIRAQKNSCSSATPTPKRRLNADLSIAAADPVQAELENRPRWGTSRTPPAKKARPARQSAVDVHRDQLMEEVRQDPQLQEKIREMLAMPEKGSEAAVHAQNTRRIAASLKDLQKHCKSNIGRIVYSTVVAAAAGAGEHTCPPEKPCTPDQRCRPVEGDGGVSLARRAESLGVRLKTFREARIRMHNTDHSIPPAEAVEQARYCWEPRKKRSDATDPRVLKLGGRFWHTDGISRASGDSGKKQMWRPSKRKDEEYHSRRELMVSGDKVYRKFLDWPEYEALKAELLREDSTYEDPGRTTFLATRCGCLVEPKVSQCACQTHTQQSKYLEALKWLMGAVHADCDCTCDWCDGEGCKRWSNFFRSLHNFSEELCCDLLEGDSSGGFEYFARRPACVAGDCADCGFGKPNGVPDCEALKKNFDRPVGWIRFGDQKMPDGQVHKKQQLPQQGSLEKLWKEFVAHSLLAQQEMFRD